MSGIDDAFDQAAKLSGKALEKFLAELPEAQRDEVKRKLRATVLPDSQSPILSDRTRSCSGSGRAVWGKFSWLDA